MKRKINIYTIIIMSFFCLVVIPFTFSKYTTKINNKLTLNATQPEYDVIFDSNAPSGYTVTGSMSNEHFIYGTPKNLTTNNYIINGLSFTGWSTESDGSGEFYTDGELVDKLTGTNGGVVTLYAQWRDVIAEIDGTFYNTLQAAVNAVPTDNTETTIKLLWNTSETVTTKAGQNIVFNLQNYTISNNGSSQVIINNGKIAISNGKIISSAGFAAVDNKPAATMIMSGGSIVATGERQAIYNEGILEISGDAYLSSSFTAIDKERGTVTNTSKGTCKITGGTIIATAKNGIYNEGNMTIGTLDGDTDVDSLIIQGAEYGIKSTTNFNMYDGIIKGSKTAFSDVTKVTGKEDGYVIVRGIETINGVKYKTGRLGYGQEVIFDANGGSVDESIVYIEADHSIGVFPTATNDGGYILDGWYTAREGGDKISEDTIIVEDTTFYAHWKEMMIAEVNGNEYVTLQAAINAVPNNNTKTTVTILNDTTENVTINAGKNIVFDFGNHTINNKTSYSVITNNGTVEITNGNILTKSTTASAINNNKNATILISGGNIIATGQRQAFYNDGGTAEITGSAYLCSSITSTDKERGTVHNLAGSTLKITGGTIVSTTNKALYNLGTLTIGTKDGNINTTSPVFQGATNGIKSTTNFNFYDGIAKGKTKAIENENKISDKEDNSVITHVSETIDSDTYDTAYLTQN